jgi:hypothetical protein
MQFLLPAPVARTAGEADTAMAYIALQPLAVVSHFMRTTRFGALEYVSALIPHHACANSWVVQSLSAADLTAS